MLGDAQATAAGPLKEGTQPMTETNRSTLMWGLLLILAGVLFLLINLNLIPVNLSRLWPVPALGAGLWLLAQSVARRTREHIVGGMVLTTLGAYWLLRNLNYVDDGLFLPLLLIALGAGTLLRSLIPE